MLVLTRKTQEVVVIGGTDGVQLMTIKVLSVNNGRVRLGFEASKEVWVRRQELLDEGRTGAPNPPQQPSRED